MLEYIKNVNAHQRANTIYTSGYSFIYIRVHIHIHTDTHIYIRVLIHIHPGTHSYTSGYAYIHPGAHSIKNVSVIVREYIMVSLDARIRNTCTVVRTQVIHSKLARNTSMNISMKARMIPVLPSLLSLIVHAVHPPMCTAGVSHNSDKS